MHKVAVAAERAAQVYAALAAFTFALSGVVYLYLGSASVTHGDFWELYTLYLNHPWFESVLRKYCGHSFLLPSILWLGDLRFFHGSQQLLFFIGLALLFAYTSTLLASIWYDSSVGVTTKITSTLVVIGGVFWMARSPVTASAGNNCHWSLAMAGATLAFTLTPRLRTHPGRLWLTMLLVVSAGFVASFSNGAGLAIWPTLLILAWCLRLPRHLVGVLLLAGSAAAILLMLLPDWVPQATYGALRSLSFSGAPLISLCRLIGSPVSYATFAWFSDTSYQRPLDSSYLAAFSGAIGLMLGLLAILAHVIRRDLTKTGLSVTAFSVTVFTLFALVIVTVGRVAGAPPTLALAPRYLFWSTLFWGGLLLIAIQKAESTQWLRWPVYTLVLAVPILMLPEHYKVALVLRQAKNRLEFGATSLINHVRDDHQVAILLYGEGHLDELIRVYSLAEQFRAHRLDMFAEGLQDWIGLNETTLFGGRHKPEGLKGQCRVAAVVQTDDGAPAARVIGESLKQGGIIAKRLVIVDPSGIICGVARCLPTGPFINQVFYLRKANTNGFLGYIRDYNPKLQYVVHSADDGVLSEEPIPVRIPITNPN